MDQKNRKDAAFDTLTDISDIEIDMEKSVSDRIEDYIQKTGSPLLVRVGEFTVEIGYSDCTDTLNDRMKQYIKKAAEIKY